MGPACLARCLGELVAFFNARFVVGRVSVPDPTQTRAAALPPLARLERRRQRHGAPHNARALEARRANPRPGLISPFRHDAILGA